MTGNRQLTLATWNICGCVGRDGRHEPQRTIAALRSLDADVIALQEVQSDTDGELLQELASGTGMRIIAGPTMQRHGGQYGNALLSRLPVSKTRRFDLSVGRHEPRGAIATLVDTGRGRKLEVVATHFGLFPGERREQVRRLLASLPALVEDEPGVLLGDFNEWFLWGRPIRWLRGRYGATPHIPTFPARWPLLSLDRIWVRPRDSLIEVGAVRDAAVATASDHLPLRAVIELA